VPLLNVVVPIVLLAGIDGCEAHVADDVWIGTWFACAARRREIEVHDGIVVAPGAVAKIVTLTASLAWPSSTRARCSSSSAAVGRSTQRSIATEAGFDWPLKVHWPPE
jgi:hypothetical protein